MKLYAPIIDSKIPAFLKSNNNNIHILKIPFKHNDAVDLNLIDGYQVRMWKYNDTIDNALKGQYIGEYIEEEKVDCKIEGSNDEVKVGQYYKIQLAYMNKNGEPQTYSSIGITKCVGTTGNAKCYIADLDEGENAITHSYQGYYENTDLPSETVSQYRFTFNENLKGTIIEDTGWRITSPGKDMLFEINQELDSTKQYSLKFSVETINGLLLESEYSLEGEKLSDNPYEGTIITAQDQKAIENGYVSILLNQDPFNYNIDVFNGFRILRKNLSNSSNNYWEIIVDSKEEDIHLSWKDFTVEQGCSYKYAIQYYSNSGYSKKVESDIITVKFEDMFLADEKRQLRIAFNPKVSSFKKVKLEQKIETIGSKYPFIIQNAHVGYKELPLSGLISYAQDKDGYFYSQNIDFSTNLTNENFYNERIFKTEVLNWLSNGKPKLFRSPAEGNFVLSLQGISLAPNDTLGRMLHTFSATGYEVMDNNLANLKQANLIFKED